jgi:hypothetical protein
MQPFTSLADVCEISTTEVTQMALKDAIQTQSMPAFETDEEHDTMTAEVPAVAQTTAVGAARAPMKFPPIYADKQDNFDIETVVGLSMAVERIKAEQGACYIGNDSLGTRSRVEIISWNYRWILSPGLQSKDPGYEESKQFLANTYDNQTVYGKDVTVEEYLQELKEAHAYDKANKSMYIDLFGMLVWTEKKGEIPGGGAQDGGRAAVPDLGWPVRRVLPDTGCPGSRRAS